MYFHYPCGVFISIGALRNDITDTTPAKELYQSDSELCVKQHVQDRVVDHRSLCHYFRNQRQRRGDTFVADCGTDQADNAVRRPAYKICQSHGNHQADGFIPRPYLPHPSIFICPGHRAVSNAPTNYGDSVNRHYTFNCVISKMLEYEDSKQPFFVT